MTTLQLVMHANRRLTTIEHWKQALERQDDDNMISNACESREFDITLSSCMEAVG